MAQKKEHVVMKQEFIWEIKKYSMEKRLRPWNDIRYQKMFNIYIYTFSQLFSLTCLLI